MISLRSSLQRLFRKTTSVQKTFVYVALGDSVAEGIGATNLSKSYTSVIYSYLRKKHKRVEFHNFSRIHAPSSWVLKEQIEKAVTLKPDLITLSIGANDMRTVNMPWKFREDLQKIIAVLQENTDATIVINSIPDFSHTQAIPFVFKSVARFLITQYNNVIESVARDRGVMYVDLFQTSGVFAHVYPELTGEDGFHPSDLGHALWAQSILGELRKTV